jgi:AcrR family transcriptional regulator
MDGKDRTLDIHVKAAQIFHEKGFSGTSVDDLARALQLTKAGLYYYIKSKEDLLFSLMSHAMDWLEQDVIEPARAEADPRRRLDLIVRRHGRELLNGRRVISILFDEAASLTPKHRQQIQERKRVYFDLVRDTLQELKAKGLLRDVNPTVASFSLFGVLMWLPRWYQPEGRLSADQVLEEITKLVFGGLFKSS